MLEKALVVGMPSRDLSVLGKTVSNICATSHILKMGEPEFIWAGGNSVCTARDSILRGAREILKKDSGRILWVDSDIWIVTQPAELARYLEEADERNYNIVAPYKRLDNNTAYLSSVSKDGEVISWEGVERMEQYAKVDCAGLGFYYGYTPFDYSFHIDGKFFEDYYFFTENKIELRLEKRISLRHNKRGWI